MWGVCASMHIRQVTWRAAMDLSLDAMHCRTQQTEYSRARTLCGLFVQGLKLMAVAGGGQGSEAVHQTTGELWGKVNLDSHAVVFRSFPLL